MNSATITRENYVAEAVYFIPSGNYRIESMSPDYSVRLSSATATEAALQAVLADHAVLVVNQNKASIQANGVETVTLSITGQMSFEWRLMRENIEIDSGSENDGTLVFSTDDAALYTFELKIGQQTGYAQLWAL